jgi:hypothetical protein
MREMSWESLKIARLMFRDVVIIEKTGLVDGVNTNSAQQSFIISDSVHQYPNRHTKRRRNTSYLNRPTVTVLMMILDIFNPTVRCNSVTLVSSV